MAARSRYFCVDAQDPQAAGRCDRGGEIRPRSELMPQMMFAGDRLVPTGYLVCHHHMDRPQAQDRNINLSIDPRPVRDARPAFDGPGPLVVTGLLDVTFRLDESALA